MVNPESEIVESGINVKDECKKLGRYLRFEILKEAV